MHRGRLRSVVATLVGGLLLASAFAPRALTQPEGKSPDRLVSQVGAMSCSAQACHGSLRPLEEGNVLRNEYTTWQRKDPHAQAYAVLRNERSQYIARNLNERDSGGKLIPAHENARCLACHATPYPVADPAERETALRDGVSCEACHGPAQHWLIAHTSRSWEGMEAAAKRAEGYYPLGGLVDRVQTCAGCHVGSPPDPARGIAARDCNHDIMAAGHPRLNFEFAAFQANQPRHWIEKKLEDTSDARFWAVGQAVSAAAALDLLAYRSRLPQGPWPEFAEYNCFACHHGLHGLGFRQTVGGYYKNRVPGSLPWGDWYLTMPMEIAKIGPVPDAELPPLLADLHKLMSRPLPPREQVAELATKAAQRLRQWARKLDAHRFQQAEAFQLRSRLAAKWKELAGPSWDGAGQLYLAFAALNHAVRAGKKPDGGKEAEIDPAMQAFARQLAFPAYENGNVLGFYESPKGYRYDEQAFESALGKLSTLMQP